MGEYISREYQVTDQVQPIRIATSKAHTSEVGGHKESMPCSAFPRRLDVTDFIVHTAGKVPAGEFKSFIAE
jgi:hypothetical protein